MNSGLDKDDAGTDVSEDAASESSDAIKQSPLVKHAAGGIGGQLAESPRLGKQSEVLNVGLATYKRRGSRDRAFGDALLLSRKLMSHQIFQKELASGLGT